MKILESRIEMDLILSVNKNESIKILSAFRTQQPVIIPEILPGEIFVHRIDLMPELDQNEDIGVSVHVVKKGF